MYCAVNEFVAKYWQYCSHCYVVYLHECMLCIWLGCWISTCVSDSLVKHRALNYISKGLIKRRKYLLGPTWMTHSSLLKSSWFYSCYYFSDGYKYIRIVYPEVLCLMFANVLMQAQLGHLQCAGMMDFAEQGRWFSWIRSF